MKTKYKMRWSTVMPILIEAIEHGNDERRKHATEELTRLGLEVDRQNAELEKAEGAMADIKSGNFDDTAFDEKRDNDLQDELT